MACLAEFTAIESDLHKELHEKKQKLIALVLNPTFDSEENCEVMALTIEVIRLQERLHIIFNQINN